MATDTTQQPIDLAVLPETEIDFSATLNSITDTDLFKYFLNDDFGSDTNSEGLLLSSPPSSLDASSSDSPQHSPPQLSPELHDFINSAPLVSVPAVPVFQTPLVDMELSPVVPIAKIKQETSILETARPQRGPTIVQHIELPHEAKNKNSRKRTAPAKDAQDLTSSLSKDELFKLSAKGTENLIHVPREEEKVMKRQKRLIKNRESAQLSRLRKKIYIEELEKKVNHLTGDNDALTKQVNSLTTDKKRLQEEVLYLQSIIKQNPDLSSALANRKPPFQPKNVKAAGVCLLVILFSMGLLFNSNQNSNLPFSKASREEIPEVIPKSTLYTGRVLKSITQEEPISKIEIPSSISTVLAKNRQGDEEEIEAAIAPITKSLTMKDKKHPREELDSVIPEKKATQSITTTRKRMKISEESYSDDDGSNKGLVPLDAIPVKRNVESELVPRRNPNASYIYCPEAHHLAPATSTNSGPEMIALLLPASVLNGSIHGNLNLDSSLLEVSCQILNLHMWPLVNATAQH